eukprot:5413628-Pyramimonas_sp.AAC.1
MLHFSVDACLEQIRRGRWSLHELPRTAASWKSEWVQWLAGQPGVFLVKSDMCQFGMVGKGSDGSEGPVRKLTGWLTSNAALA